MGLAVLGDDFLRAVVASEDPDLPQAEMAAELLDLRAEAVELRGALKQLYGVASHRKGCPKSVPEEGTPEFAARRNLPTCPCGLRQAVLRARRMLLPPEERVARAVMGDDDLPRQSPGCERCGWTGWVARDEQCPNCNPRGGR